MYNKWVPFSLALALHLVLLICLLSNFTLFSHQRVSSKPNANNTIKAIAVNPNELKQQLQKLKAAEQAKLNAERQRQEEIKQKEEAAEKKIEEQKKAEANASAEALAKAEKIIKIKKEKQKKEEAQKKAAEEKKIEEALQKQMDKKKEQAAKKNKKEQERALQQQLANEAKEEQAAAEASSAMQGELDKYKGLILDALQQNWIVPDNASKDLSAKLLIRLAPGGMVLDVKLVKSSGDSAFDRSAIAAVHKASPLPVPEEPELFDKMRELSLTVQPEG